MRRYLTGARIFTGTEIIDDEGVLIEDGRILDIGTPLDIADSVDRSHIETVQLPEDALLVPGFIDAQVNGGGGVLFNETPTADGIRTIVAAHRRFGTTGLLPTFITDAPEPMRQAAQAAIALTGQRGSGVLGLHLEGPYLDVARRGVHKAEFIREPSDTDIDELCAWAGQFPGGRLHVTIAPEHVGDAAIRRLAEAGIAVSAAHSGASFERTKEAIGAGLTGFTHLFNAMPPVVNRDPRIAAAGMTDDATWCGIIADGIHVHPALLKLTITAKPRGKVFLVTDAMPPLGTEAESFELNGQTILRHDGRLTTEDGTLAGADLDLPTAIRNCLSLLGLELEEALRMASLYPAEFLGLEDRRGRIAPGYIADLTLLSPEIAVLGTWVDGGWESAAH